MKNALFFLLLCLPAVAQDAPRYTFGLLLPQTGFELTPGQARYYNIAPTVPQEITIAAGASSGLDVAVVDVSGEPAIVCRNLAVTAAATVCNLDAGKLYRVALVDSRTGDRAKLGILTGLLSRGKQINLTPNKCRVAVFVLLRDGSPSLYLGDAPRP